MNSFKELVNAVFFIFNSEPEAQTLADFYQHGNMNTEHPKVMFKVRDYTTVMVGRWDNDKKIAYVYRGDGTILSVYDEYRIVEMSALVPDRLRTATLRMSKPKGPKNIDVEPTVAKL